MWIRLCILGDGYVSCFTKWIATSIDYRADEELDMSDDQIAQDVDMHGKIVITVERGKREKTECRDPFAAQLWDGYDAPDTKISSKRVVKDSCVSHAVK
jgi:hypothetical protein